MEAGTSMTDSNLKDYNNFYDSLIPHSFPTDLEYLLKVFFFYIHDIIGLESTFKEDSHEKTYFALVSFSPCNFWRRRMDGTGNKSIRRNNSKPTS